MKILSFNLRHHRDRWEERFPLVVDVIATHRPDIIGFQEVWRPIDQADIILDKVPDNELTHLHVLPKQGEHGQEGVAIASRYPVISHETLDLPNDGGRVAQRALLDVDGKRLCFVNTHLHDKPQDESIRLPQMQVLLNWLAEVNDPMILTGDMNARPESATILEAKKQFQSAYEAIHGREPEVTCPTPLDPNYHPDRDTTIDYVFFSGDELQVIDASVVANEPHPDDDTLYPSDHFGVLATIQY